MKTSIVIQFLTAMVITFSVSTPYAVAQTKNSQPVLNLGKITVHGQKNIVRVLQAIKVSLDQPYSTDSKLQNVVVCRLEEVAGSHLEKLLICATNRTLSGRLNAIQAAIAGKGDPGNNMFCASTSCYEATFGDINTAIESSRGKTLEVMVDGPVFHEVLDKIPYPKWYHLKTAKHAPVTSTAQ